MIAYVIVVMLPITGLVAIAVRKGWGHAIVRWGRNAEELVTEDLVETGTARDEIQVERFGL